MKMTKLEITAEVMCWMATSSQPTGSAIHDGTRRDPVDKIAAMTMARGVRFENNVNFDCHKHWEICPPLRKIDKTCQLDFTGKVCGRFTVVGLHATIKKRWVVRCSCGNYELRTTRALRNPNNYGDRCLLCRNMAFHKKDYAFHKQGTELDQREL